MNDNDLREAVRDRYGRIGATGGGDGGCCGPAGCGAAPSAEDVSKNLGYSEEDLAGAPEGSNLGLGCGNPQAIAALKPGETVLDLGSGAGFDGFLAARQVGENGTVIGVDMTPEMVSRARENARRVGTTNVEFRLGEIEHLPVADGSVDVILSNCVINLAPDKRAVYREAFRVLKPGGRLAVFDIVATSPLPESLRDDVELHTGCVAGAVTASELEAVLTAAGFRDVSILPREGSPEVIEAWLPDRGLAEYVVSATIQATKR